MKANLRKYFRCVPPTGALISAAPQYGSGFVAEGDTGSYAELSDDEIVQRALDITARRVESGPVLSNPRATRDYLRLRLSALEHEVFGVLWLNNRNKIVAAEELFTGTIDGATVHPREVVKAALRVNACACILYHNHPSGIAEPSQADELITRRIKESLAVVDIRVLDHLVIGREECRSMAESGMI